MSTVFSRQKAALTRALKTEDMSKVVRVCAQAIELWRDHPDFGHWPDDWHRWERALDDTFNAHKRRYIRDDGRNGERTVSRPWFVDMDTIAQYLAIAGNVDTAMERMGF